MVKIEIYPLRDDASNRVLVNNSDRVDFESTPVVAEVLGWINGLELRETKHGTMDVLDGYRIRYDNVELPCIMAVVEIDGKIQQIEHYRVKILKEE